MGAVNELYGPNAPVAKVGEENIKYIDIIEKNIIEQYYLSKDIPIEAYQLLKIYSFIIKYSQFFNISN